VVIDGRTRFPEVEIVKSTSASSTIPQLHRIFSTHGLPKKIITDNGRPFTSYEIQKFMNDNKIHQHKITPLWPQGNAEAENFMKPLMYPSMYPSCSC
jgi:transposase InsO family protein